MSPENASTVQTDDFPALADPYRRELFAHCYRMVGSVHDAEDLVQETYLRAWRAYHGFEGRSSLRTWMYQIATNTCLTALQSRKRRPPTRPTRCRPGPRSRGSSRCPTPSWPAPRRRIPRPRR